jgi:hypothetical protein
MMQTGDKVLSVSAGVLIVLAFVLKAVIPQTTYRIGFGSRYYRPDSVAFWVFLILGLILGVIVVLKIIMRSDAV